MAQPAREGGAGNGALAASNQPNKATHPSVRLIIRARPQDYDASEYITASRYRGATSLEQIRAFLSGNEGCGSPDSEEVYVWSINRAPELFDRFFHSAHRVAATPNMRSVFP